MSATSIADFISSGFGHTVNRERARSDGYLRSAQTETALSQARERRAKAVEAEKINAQRDAILQDPTLLGGDRNVMLANVLAAGYGNFDQVTQGAGNLQTQGFRDTVASPTATNPDRYRAMEAASLKPVENYYNPAPGLTVDRNAGTAPTVNPIGQAQIDNYHEVAGGGLNPDGTAKPLVRSSNGVSYEKQPDGSWKPIVQTDAAAAQAAALAAARAGGKIHGEAAATLPDAEADVDKLSASVDGLLNDPGFDSIYGPQGTFTNNKVGQMLSPAIASADARRKNIDAQTFGVAVQKMRGLGQLSNAEGMKVTDAFTRAGNPQLHPAQAREAWGEVQAYLALAKQRAQRKAQVPGAPGLAPAALARPAAPAAAGGPREGDIEDGYQFGGGDPKDPANWYQVAQ